MSPSTGESPTKRLEKKRRPRWLRALRALVVTLFALAAAYLIGVNVLLSTSVLEKLDTVEIHYERGWSVVPGRIHAKHLTIRGTDSNVEWILRLDEAEFDMSFVALLHQRFEASHVRGKGVSFRLRQRLDAPPTSPEQVADLPPIEGFGAYGVRPPKGPDRDVWSDADYHLWTVHLEDVVAEDVREVWIDHERFEGDATVVGRFYLKPLRAVEVGPIHVDVRRGDLHAGERALTQAMGGDVDVAIARFDPRTTHGADLLHEVSVGTDVHATCPDVANLRLPLPAGMTASGAIDVRRLVLHVTRGVVQSGSHADVTASAVAVASGEHRLTGALDGSADVGRVEDVPRLDVRATLRGAEIARTEGPRLVLSAARVVVAADSRALDLAEPLGDLHVAVDVPEGELPDASALEHYVPTTTPLSIQGGRARADVHVDVWSEEKRAAVHATMRADDLDFRLAKLRVRGSTAAEATIASYRWDLGSAADARLTLHISRGSVASARAPRAPLVEVRDLHLDARGNDVDVSDPLRAVQVAIVVPDATLVDHGLLQAYLPDEMRVMGDAHFTLTCHAATTDHLARGTLAVRSKVVRFDYRDLAVAGEIRASARVHDWRWERGDLALDRALVDLIGLTVRRRDVAAGAVGAAGAPGVDVGRISFSATSPRFAFADPLGHVALTASIVGAALHDSAVVDELLPRGSTLHVEADGGTLGSEIRADVADHVATARILLSAAHLGVGAKALHLRGDVDVSAQVTDWKLHDAKMQVLDSRVALSRVQGRLAERGSDFAADRIVILGSSDALDLAHPSLSGADVRVVVDDATLPDARALAVFLPKGIVTIQSGSARVRADVRLSSSSGSSTGNVDVTLSHAGFSIHETKIVGDFHVAARIDGGDPRQGLYDVAGSRVEMRNVEVTHASTGTSRWFGDLVLEEGAVRVAPVPELDARFALDARDASPLLAVLLRNGVPGIFVGLTHMPRFAATARLTVRPHEVTLRDVEALGGDLQLRGLYASRADHRRGAFLVRKGVFSWGMRLDDGGTSLRFFGLDGWYGTERRAVMRLVDPP